MKQIKAKISRCNIGGKKTGNVWVNVIWAGRKIVGSIFEPCALWPGKYQIEISIAPGYMLKSEADTMPDAVLEFDRLTDSQYYFN